MCWARTKYILVVYIVYFVNIHTLYVCSVYMFVFFLSSYQTILVYFQHDGCNLHPAMAWLEETLNHDNEVHLIKTLPLDRGAS